MNTITTEAISPEQWQWVRNLIQDVSVEVERDEFAANLVAWDMAAKQFRRAELVRMENPTSEDLLAHAACIHLLLSIGSSLLIKASKLGDRELEPLKVKLEQVKAYLADLYQDLREWHHGLPEAEIANAQLRIFGAAA